MLLRVCVSKHEHTKQIITFSFQASLGVRQDRQRRMSVSTSLMSQASHLQADLNDDNESLDAVDGKVGCVLIFHDICALLCVRVRTYARSDADMQPICFLESCQEFVFVGTSAVEKHSVLTEPCWSAHYTLEK